MAGSRKKQEQLSEFWCIKCGRKGIPILRNRGNVKEKGHRKALYCITCKETINHIETRNEEEERIFQEEFTAGKYEEEAERSSAFAKENHK